MNPRLLIDAIVQQTTVLIAQLSTAAGVRAPLSRIADQVFLDLTRELQAQGVGRKVAADMFGMALRTYQSKVQRLESSVSDKDTTLWEAVLSYVESHENCGRKELFQHFDEDDPLNIGAILKDLCNSGILYRTGTGASVLYRAVPEFDREIAQRAQDAEALATLVRVAIYRGASNPETLMRRLGASAEALEEALNQLIADGVVRRRDDGHLSTVGVSIPPGAPVGFEAAVFDHYQALVTAITRRLEAASTDAPNSVGGGTVSFVMSPGHPLQSEVHQLLQQMRDQLNNLWERVGEEQKKLRATGTAGNQVEVVTFYFGQSSQEEER